MQILIAEDDKDIAFMYMKLLEDRGHRVIVTNDGQQCLIAYDERTKKLTKTTNIYKDAQPFDAVILDHMMPRMDAFEVAKEIVSINPLQRIIIASGYSKEIFDEAAQHFHVQIEILQKPFSRTALVELVEANYQRKVT